MLAHQVLPTQQKDQFLRKPPQVPPQKGLAAACGGWSLGVTAPIQRSALFEGHLLLETPPGLSDPLGESPCCLFLACLTDVLVRLSSV